MKTTNKTSNRAAVAFKGFREAVAAQGGEVLATEWMGSRTGHAVRCGAGHLAYPRPNNVVNGQGICRTCGGRDPVAAWQAFRDSVEALGGEVLEGAWKGKDAPHTIRCAFGHTGYPTPGSIQRGNGICRVCAHKVWDAFYVVRNPGADTLKFGVTSGNPKSRLTDHARDGFTEVLRTFEGLPEGGAKELEDEVRVLLAVAGVRPVRGREYFSDAVSAVVLSVVDNWFV